MEIQKLLVVQFFSTRAPFKTPNRAGKCGNAQHLQMKQCTALLCFLLVVCEAWLLHRNQESLIHMGSQRERKASRTIPILGAYGEIQRSVNPEPLSLLRARDSGQCFTMAPVEEEEGEEGKECARDVATSIETAEISRDKTTILQSDIKKSGSEMVLW